MTVTLTGASASAKADAKGVWSLTLPAMPAGGPHILDAPAAPQERRLRTIFWSATCGCAPGSPTWNGRCATTLDAGSEVALSANDRIRQVTIARANSAAPRTDFDAPLEWRVAGPTTTEHFSAVCYYFVRELQKTVNVPQGIISSNWGGSRIEPWMSEAALRRLDGYQAAARVVRRVSGEQARGVLALGRDLAEVVD